ncbi:hypothetical protein JTB14_003820, partial [Gonioctena quinquepunctata]
NPNHVSVFRSCTQASEIKHSSKQFDKPVIQDVIKFEPITAYEIVYITEVLKPNKALGLDNIQPTFLKQQALRSSFTCLQCIV